MVLTRQLIIKGPYSQFGEVVVKACVSLGTDYVDITGEARWVDSMKQKYERIAKQNGVVLIPFAGHDSVPSDVTSWFTISQVSSKEMEESHAALITAVKMPPNSSISNGTLKTLVNYMGTDQYEDPSIPKPRLNGSIFYLKEVPEKHGGPLVVLPSKLFPDGKIIMDTQNKLQTSRTGVIESNFGFVLPNRVMAYSTLGFLKIFPYLLKFPYLSHFLDRMMGSGDGFKFLPTSQQISYSVYGILKVYPLKGGFGDTPPIETIVTRLDFDRDPYEVTAICCTQISLALCDQNFRTTCPGVENGFGFQTPVSGIGGQEILNRCFECVRFQLVSRL